MDKAAAKSAQEQRGKPFKPGQSGNPAGRKAGSRNKATLLLQAMIVGQGEQIVQECIERAMAGDNALLKALLERLVPARKDAPVELKLPPLRPENLTKASATVVAAVAGGKLTPSEGEALARVLEGHRKAVETLELETRLAKLEAAMGGN